jgi:hypothetical protein
VPERRRANYNDHLDAVVHDHVAEAIYNERAEHDYLYGATDDPADNPHDSAIDWQDATGQSSGARSPVDPCNGEGTADQGAPAHG